MMQLKNFHLAVVASAFAMLLSTATHAGLVADLESLQAAHSNIQHHYTFEGTYVLPDQTGTWLDNKAAASPALVQTLFEPARKADQQTPGYDSSTNFADFLGWASGGKGDGLTAMPITFATSGTIEYLVQFGPMDTSSHFMVSGDGTGANDRFQFLIAYGGATATAQMTLGTNTPVDVIGGTTAVPYQEDDWYYVAQNWDIAGGSVTMDAWVANLTDGGALTKTVDGVSNTFAGDTVAELYLANLANISGFFADGGLDAIAIYDAPLDAATITSHFNTIAIPETSSFVSMCLAFVVMAGVRRRRWRSDGRVAPR